MKFKKHITLLLLAIVFLIFSCRTETTKESIKNVEPVLSIDISAQEFTITNIEKSGNTYSVELNKNLLINFIEINGYDVLLPANRDLKTNKEFKYISADNRQTEDFLTRIKSAVYEYSKNDMLKFDGAYQKFTPEIIEISLVEEKEQRDKRGRIITPRRRGPVIKGYVTIVSARGLIITNILIKSINEQITIDWPSALINKKKQPIIDFIDKENLKEINDMLINKYFEKAAVRNEK